MKYLPIYILSAFLIFNLYYSTLYATSSNYYICITSTIQINHKSKSVLSASKDNIDTDNDGETNYYEFIQQKHRSIDLISIFSKDYLLNMQDNQITFNDTVFSKIQDQYINKKLNLSISTTAQEKDIKIHITNNNNIDDKNFHLVCSLTKKQIEQNLFISKDWLNIFQNKKY